MSYFFLFGAASHGSRFTHVVLVDASSEINLKADLQSWTQLSGSRHEEDDWNNCLEFLASGPHEGRWALIFDNADDPNVKLERFFPISSNGTIFVISRNSRVKKLATIGHLKLDRMTTDDALTILEGAADRQISRQSKEFESALTLIQELGYLPLALVHAGTYCRSHSSGDEKNGHVFTLDQYHSLFRQQRIGLMNKAGSLTDQHGVYTALEMSYQAAAPHARQFLHIISSYHCSEIPYVMFSFAAKVAFCDPVACIPRPDEHPNVVAQLTALLCTDGEADEIRLSELIANLRSFSLLSPSKGSDFLRVQPFVHSWIRDMPSKAGDDYRAMATQIITSCCFDGCRQIYRYFFSHINDILETMKITDLHVNDKLAFGWALDDCGHYKKAEELFKEGLDIICHMSEDETEEMIDLIAGRATSYVNQGCLAKAEKLESVLLEKCQRLLGPDDPKSLAAAAYLAVTYENQGLWDEVEKLEVDLLERYQRILGSNHYRSLRMASNLALNYWNQGLCDKAQKLAVETLENSKRVLGTDHLDSLNAAANLAVIHRKLGHYNEAEKLEVDVLEKRRVILGADHPFTISARSNLADTYLAGRRWEDAEPILECLV